MAAEDILWKVSIEYIGSSGNIEKEDSRANTLLDALAQVALAANYLVKNKIELYTITVKNYKQVDGIEEGLDRG